MLRAHANSIKLNLLLNPRNKRRAIHRVGVILWNPVELMYALPAEEQYTTMEVVALSI